MKIIVLGGGGFIGGHLATRLTEQGHQVLVADIKEKPDYDVKCWRYVETDLRNPDNVRELLEYFRGADELYQLAADMGGAGYIFTGENDANVMHNSATINLNVVKAVCEFSPMTKVFYSSSACVYREDPNNPNCAEADAYPALPDSAYGWEKLFSENLYAAAHRNYSLDVRIARFHNIFGPKGTWQGGKEKAPAAMMRKVAESNVVEIWGTGEQTRSFLYIDECLEAMRRLMDSDYYEPINIGSDEMVTINGLAEMAARVAGKDITIKHTEGPIGVNGRCSDNTRIREVLGWAPSMTLWNGIRKTYPWIAEQVASWKS